MKASTLIVLLVCVAVLGWLVWLHDQQLKEIADAVWNPSQNGLPPLPVEDVSGVEPPVV